MNVKRIISMLLILTIISVASKTANTTCLAYTETEKKEARRSIYSTPIDEDFYMWSGGFQYHIYTQIDYFTHIETVTITDIKKPGKSLIIPNTVKVNGEERKVTAFSLTKKANKQLSKVCEKITAKGIASLKITNLSKLKQLNITSCNAIVKNCPKLKHLKKKGWNGLRIADCPNLRTFSMKKVDRISLENNSNIKSLKMHCKYLGTFYDIEDCKKLKTLEFWGSVCYFRNIVNEESLVDIKLHGVTIVYENSFNNCSGVRSVTFPKTVKYIYGNVFTSYCNNIRKVKFLCNKVPQRMNKTTFKGLSKKCKMYVKNKTMKQAVKQAGFRGQIIIMK